MLPSTSVMLSCCICELVSKWGKTKGIYLVVSDNLGNSICACSDDFLDNVAQVVDEKAESFSVLRNGSELEHFVNFHLV